MTAIASDGRSRILMVLQESREPLPNVEVSRLARLPLQQAKNRLAGLIRDGAVINVGTRKGGLYALADPRSMVVTVRTEVAASNQYRWRDCEPYTGEKPLPTRPGALDFLTAPSVENGVRVERKRPMLITARVSV